MIMEHPPPSYESVNPSTQPSVVLRPEHLHHVVELPPYTPKSTATQVVQPSDRVVQTNVQPPAPPPSYESLYGRVKAAREESTSGTEFCCKVIFIILGSVGCMVVLAVTSAHPIAEIVIGALHLHECPAQRYLPIYLIVMGVFTLVKFISLFCQFCTNKSQNEGQEGQEENSKTNPVDQLCNIFMFAWFIAGNVWVYGMGDSWVSDSSNKEFYCDSTLFYFTFWSITSMYILLAVLCVTLCLAGFLGHYLKPPNQQT